MQGSADCSRYQGFHFEEDTGDLGTEKIDYFIMLPFETSADGITITSLPS